MNVGERPDRKNRWINGKQETEPSCANSPKKKIGGIVSVNQENHEQSLRFTRSYAGVTAVLNRLITVLFYQLSPSVLYLFLRMARFL